MKLVLVEPRPGLDHETIWPLVGVGGLLLAHLPADSVSLAWVCPFRAVTGLACPGCGGTRALLALAHLDLAAAFAWNPVVAAGGLALVVFSAYAIVALLLRTRRVRLVSLTLAERVAATALVLANWAYLVAAGR